MASRGVTIPCNWITLVNVHPKRACKGRPCPIHNPSKHHMRYWRLHWRDDRKIFERICPHGVGHPDLDQFEFWESIGKASNAIHGCCGYRCCAERE